MRRRPAVCAVICSDSGWIVISVTLVPNLDQILRLTNKNEARIGALLIAGNFSDQTHAKYSSRNSVDLKA